MTICALCSLFASCAKRRKQAGIGHWHGEPAEAEIDGAGIYEAGGCERERAEMEESGIYRAELHAGPVRKEMVTDPAAKIAMLEERIQELERHISPESTHRGMGSQRRF